MRPMTVQDLSPDAAMPVRTAGGIPDLDRWMFGTVLPFWADAGVDRTGGGFVERLTREAVPADDDYKRIRVQARQIYVFSHAHVLGAGDYALPAAREGYRFMTRHGWDSDGGGWCFAVRRDGSPLNRRKEFYCQAFAMLAMAWHHRATGDAEPIAWARRTMDFLDRTLADRRHGGYFEAAENGAPVPDPVRRQNPHMHLFEAVLALHEATGDGAWLDKALELQALLGDRFTSKADGSLGEYFTDDWRPAPGLGGRIREPGHHFEWAWLLHQLGRLTGRSDAAALASGLYRFAEAVGIDRTPGMVPATFDEVDDAGAPIKDTKRLWPQTETVKAHLAAYEQSGDTAYADRAVAHLGMMFEHYLAADRPWWREHLSRDGRDAFDFIPASSLYHLFIAIAEARRVLRL